MPPIAIPEGLPRRLARAWLGLGLAALAGSGILAILLVLSRTPGIQHVFPLRDFFRAALVVHVDLSVLVWFLAFAGVIWSLAGDRRLPALAWSGFGLTAVGTGVMAVSPFLADPLPLLNNYIPVLQQPAFLAGLALVGGGFGLTLLRSLLATWPRLHGDGSGLRWGIWFSVLAGLVALAALLASLAQAPEHGGQAYFEAVFWGGGHVLQFQHALLLLVAWWWLLAELGKTPALAPRALAAGFILAALPVAAVPVIQLAWPPGSPGHIAGYARLMEAGHSLMLPLLLAAGWAMRGTRRLAAPAKSALWASFLLFAVGGLLAFLIGYGVQRKVAGAEQVLTTLPQKLGMGMMGLGGLIAVIGGILFVWLCLKAMFRHGQPPAAPVSTR